MYLTGRISPFSSRRITPANTHECNHLSPLLEGIAEGTTVYADKGYDSKENRQHLEDHQLLDGIMRKAHRNRPLAEAQHELTELLHRWYTVFFELTESG